MPAVCGGVKPAKRPCLPCRISTASQGGGGPISVDEMRTALLLDSDEPVLAFGVCLSH